MTEEAFTPALGRFAPTRFYDAVVALTRERLWRALTVVHVAPRAGDLIVDVGCGTGSLALMLVKAEPEARIVGVDPDPEVLAIAERKARAVLQAAGWRSTDAQRSVGGTETRRAVGGTEARRAVGGTETWRAVGGGDAQRAVSGGEARRGAGSGEAQLAVSGGEVGLGAGAGVRWVAGRGDGLGALLGEGTADTVVSSLVLHQCSVPVKRAILASMATVLRPGGRLVITDYGLQRTRLMRLGFRAVQLADGREDTQPNADGLLPELIAAAGFEDVREAEVVPTVTGSISIYVARRGRGGPGGPRQG